MKTNNSIYPTVGKNNQPHDCHDEVTRALPPRLGEMIRTKFASLWEWRPHLLHLAVTEATALAVRTGYPQLFLPALALEKVEAAAAWHRRQRTTQLNQTSFWIRHTRFN
jgi:hypothetical protein